MSESVTSPVRGGDILAWAQEVTAAVRNAGASAGSGMLVREGHGGAGLEPLPENRREHRADGPHPWKVFAYARTAERGHCFEMHVPDGALHVGKAAPGIGGLTPVEGVADRYALDCEGEIAGEAVVYLAVVREEEDDGGAAPEPGAWTARIVASLDSLDGVAVLAALPIARLAVDDSGEVAVGKVKAQYAHSAVALAPGEANPDGISIDMVTADAAEDPNAIQIKDFDGDASDGGQGLAERLEVEKRGSGESADWRIRARENASKVHLVARVNGRLKYIPLTGSDEKDPDEENPPPEGDPCAHPGDKDNRGGVDPKDEPGGGSDPGTRGGVEPSGGLHPGDDGCNCD